MRMRSRRRHAGRRLLGVGAGGVGGLGADAAHTILSITNDGSGVPRVTTAAPHGLSGSELVNVSGASVAAYNTGPYTVAGAIPSATTFDLLDGPAYTTDSTGGTWALA